MISYLKGVLEEVGEEEILVEVGGIGYQVRVPARVIEALPPRRSECKIHTYTYVREDVLALYGFLTRDDLAMFQLLLGVSGVGPKGALGILSRFSAQELKVAILSQDAKAIARAPGIGAKTAQRLFIDLKGKVSFEEAFGARDDGLTAASALIQQGEGLPAARADALEALTALGYSASEALKAVRGVPGAEELDSEKLLKEALKRMR